MKQFFKELWWDLTRYYRRRFITIIVCAVLFLASFLTFHFLTADLYDQQGAARWSEEGDYAQLSCYYPVQEEHDEYDFVSLHHTLENELKLASLEETEQARLFVDACSVLGEVTITTSHGSSTVNTYGVSDDFFLFHPVELLTGSYFDDEMLMGDGVILDERTAFELFGSYNVEGMTVDINGTSSYVRAVVRQEQGHFYEAAGLEKSYCFIPFATFLKLAQKTGGYTYEAIMPNQVEGFAKGIFEKVVSDENKSREIIENSSRFQSKHLKQVLYDFGVRSMSRKGIIYPYWENVARAMEDICSFLWITEVITGCVAVLLMILFIYKEWKKRKPSKKAVSRFFERIRDRGLERIRKRKQKDSLD